MKKLNMMLAGIATLALTAGVAYAASSAAPLSVPAARAETAVSIPVDINTGTYNGPKLENNGDNVGYVKTGAKASYTISVAQAGVYAVNIDFYWFSNASDLTVKIIDNASGNTEASTVYNIAAKGAALIALEDVISAGEKTLTFDFASASGGYLVNWKNFTLDRVGDSYASLKEFKPASQDITPVAMDGYDFNYNIPVEYNASTIDFTLAHQGTSAVSVTMGEQAIEPANGVYSIPTPAMNTEAIVNIDITPADGAYSAKTAYKARFFHLGDVKLTGATIDGIEFDDDMLAALNDNDRPYIIDRYVFTSNPSIKATFMDGTSADAELLSSGNGEATYKFEGKSGDKTKTFNITVKNIHIYTKSATDKETVVKYDANFNQEDGSWNNGLFTLSPCGDGWGGKQFKLKGGHYTLTVPSDMIVKQLVLGGLADNYAPGRIKSITTNADATVYLPSACGFLNPSSAAYDLIVNIENHEAGQPFTIDIEDGSQHLMWFEFVYEEAALSTPPAVTGKSCTDLTGKNHAVVTMTFDRKVKDVEVAFNGKTVKAEGGTTVLTFALWDMEYGKEYTLTLPAGSVEDNHGNKNTEAITYTFTTGDANEPVEAIAAERFVEVTNVDELRAAVAALASTNNSADAPTTVIYIHNGDYDLGSTELATGKNVYNVSLIGESEEGVLLHGNRSGISNPVFSTRYSTNVYMENFTVRNDLDFGKPERAGVGVAHYGGNLDIMKNVTLQSNQDTQVTGERGYYLNCTIHGTVDYFCGGGDHFYDRCTIIHTIAGGYVTAPSTSPANKHGYVFMNCTIKGEGSYDLGRPWQNEPRAFFINTTMEALPKDGGWGSMGNLPTHFFEYGSKDANGNLIDLSKRRNSPTSTNSYSPILPEEHVSYFTVENVLGSTDSWLATELTAELEAPVAQIKSGVLSWGKLPKAAGYMVYADGKFVAYTADTTYSLSRARATEPAYTVQAISANGARGAMSEAATDGTTGIEAIGADNDAPVEYYNLQGIRVDNPANGVYIRRQGNSVSKVIL